MSNHTLPDPKGFAAHKTEYIAAHPKETATPSYNLKEKHRSFREDLFRADKATIRKQSNELVNYTFFKSCPYQDRIKGLFGYCRHYESVTVHLTDKEGNPIAIAVRSWIDEKGKPQKWKTYGSKKYIPYKIEDDFIFLYSGMAETIIMEMLGLSYIGIQADGMAVHLPIELKDLCKDKTIIVLQDNDKSFRDMLPTIYSFFKRSEVLVIDFERVLDRELKHGYDFRDFCNEIKDAKEVMQRLEIEIICLQDKTHVR